MRVVFGEWTPDSPSLLSSALEAKNVYPRTVNSYGPLTGLSEISNALTARARGAFTGRKASDGESYTFAGDATKLYLLSGITFLDKSISGGYALTTYDGWEFVQFGDDVIATAFSNNIQKYSLGTLPAAFSDLSSAAPKARHIGQVKDFIMVGNTYDASFGYKPNRVWWPAINDPSTWPTPGTQAAYNVQSDFQDLPTGNAVTGVLSGCGGVDGVIICETAIHVCVYEGAPNIFRFIGADESRGSTISGSIAHLGNSILYLAEDGFYSFNGSVSAPIGAGKVDKWFFSHFAQQYSHRMSSTVDPINKLVFWSFPDGELGETPNRVLIYNWAINRWSHGLLTCDLIFKTRSSSISPDSWDAIYGSPDSMTESPDSRAFIGGKLLLSAFSTDKKFSFLTGDTLEATLSTGEIGDQNGRRIFVSGVRPLIEGVASPTVALGYRNDQSENETVGSYVAKGISGVSPQRRSARYLRAYVKVPEAEDWSHALGVEPISSFEGDR